MKRFILLSLLCLVAACQSKPQEPSSDLAISSPIESNPPEVAGTDNIETPPQSSTRAQSEVDLKTLLGQDESQLIALLGQPYRVRRDPGLKVWQYDGSRCMVDFYLYQKDITYRVVYFEARDNNADLIESQQCLSSLNQHHI